jgi:hypothetical protein
MASSTRYSGVRATRDFRVLGFRIVGFQGLYFEVMLLQLATKSCTPEGLESNSAFRGDFSLAR